ncbi:hypothetical protein KBD71_04780 [Candidatus Woesebacteria bacterium]|nr:hypothetical protein [Candidatus Woesebacteria bacterium]
MKTFQDYLTSTQEIGYVQKLLHGLVTVIGIPSVRLFELVMLESGEIGQVISLTPEMVEVLLFSATPIQAGTRVVRTNERLSVGLGQGILGKRLNALGEVTGLYAPIQVEEHRGVDIRPQGIMARAPIEKPLETGVAVVDLIIPLAKGQRQLIIGDRKSGKTTFLLQTLLTQAKNGLVCVVASIGKRAIEIRQLEDFVTANGIQSQVVIVASASSDPSGLIFLTPYTAMTVAEYFRDQGKDTLIIMDDLSMHAAVYREITLIARRFPGRAAYPGDIFYTHARLMERGGNYKSKTGGSVSITVLPVIQTAMGDLAAYITTNIMSMTDGHLYFDTQLFDQGRRPSVNPFLSVTRVGLEAQTPIQRDVSRSLQSFLVQHEKMKQYTHFGAEVSQGVRDTLALGDRIYTFFQQLSDEVYPIHVSILILALLWGGLWAELEPEKMKALMRKTIKRYQEEPAFTAQVDTLITSAPDFTALVTTAKSQVEALHVRYDQ